MAEIHNLCRKRHISLGSLLREAGVSPNAFYTLTRTESVVPKTLTAVARQLGVSVSQIVRDSSSPQESLSLLMKEANRIIDSHKNLNPDNIRHTLILLDEKPIERLRRALRRGRHIDIQQRRK